MTKTAFDKIAAGLNDAVAMTTETMIERMARSIGDVVYGYVDQDDTATTWLSSLSAARAALQVLKEPTEAMVDVSYGTVGEIYSDGVTKAYGCSAVFIAMIDAALQEKVR